MIQYWQPIVSAVVTAIIAFGIHYGVSYLSDIRHQTELEEQKTALTEKCEADKKLTKKVSDEYEKTISDLNTKLNSLRKSYRLQPAVPAVPANDPAGSKNVSGQSCGDIGDNLIDLAYEADLYRLRLIGCQNYISQITE